jgi:hypothetical protein
LTVLFLGLGLTGELAIWKRLSLDGVRVLSFFDIK